MEEHAGECNLLFILLRAFASPRELFLFKSIHGSNDAFLHQRGSKVEDITELQSREPQVSLNLLAMCHVDLLN